MTSNNYSSFVVSRVTSYSHCCFLSLSQTAAVRQIIHNDFGLKCFKQCCDQELIISNGQA